MEGHQRDAHEAINFLDGKVERNVRMGTPFKIYKNLPISVGANSIFESTSLALLGSLSSVSKDRGRGRARDGAKREPSPSHEPFDLEI